MDALDSYYYLSLSELFLYAVNQSLLRDLASCVTFIYFIFRCKFPRQIGISLKRLA